MGIVERTVTRQSGSLRPNLTRVESRGRGQGVISRRVAHHDGLAQVGGDDRQPGAGLAGFHHGLSLHLRHRHRQRGPAVDHGMLAEQDHLAGRAPAAKNHACHLTGTSIASGGRGDKETGDRRQGNKGGIGKTVTRDALCALGLL